MTKPCKISQMPTEIIVWSIDWSKRGLLPGDTVITTSVVPFSGDSSYTISDVDVDGTGVFTVFTLTGGVASNVAPFPELLATANTAQGEKLQYVIPYECLQERPICCQDGCL